MPTFDYSHAPEGYVCPFCLIVQGKFVPPVISQVDDVVYQDERVTAVIGSHQWPHNPGNTLIFPNQHYENVYTLPPEYGIDIQRVVRWLALAMKEIYRCDGVSTRQHNEPAGNQDVWHYHTHVTPRFHNDNFYHTLATNRILMPPTERAAHAQRLRAALETKTGAPGGTPA